MSQTYQTRVLTARDHKLIDALEADPRYRVLAARLRPPVAKPVPRAKIEPEEVPKPTPKKTKAEDD